MARAALGTGVLQELIALASGPQAGDEAGVAAAVEKQFAQLTPEDLAALQGRLAAAEGDDETDTTPYELLTMGVQASMDKRMQTARADIDALLQSDGDIDQNIRDCLKEQDTPLPIMAVLQMNYEKSRSSGAEEQAAAMQYVLQIMSDELESQVPLANRLINQLLGCPDAASRKTRIREILLQADKRTFGSSKVTVKEISAALVQLVEDAVERYSKDDGSEASAATNKQALKGTLELVRKVGIDCGVVVGEVNGAETQEEFVGALTPLFEALSNL